MTADFYGLPTCTIRNQHLRLEFLREAGPRIVRLFFAGSNENLLAEVPNMKWPTPYGEYRIYGGHRLWHAPEAIPRSYIPDNDGLTVEDLAGGTRLRGPVEPAAGIRKSIAVHLHPDRAEVTLIHQLTNEGIWPIECAPWAITQMRLGGVAILPQPADKVDADGLLPNRRLALWPYTRWGDSRLSVNDDLILVHARAELPPMKIGYENRHGWIGYLREGVFFRKRFEPRIDQPHPDFGSNAEVYCNDQFIELETVAPLSRLEPGQSVTHVETWEVSAVPDVPLTLDGARALLADTDLAGL